MFNKIVKGIVIGAAVLSFGAGTAAADTFNLNMYGASAQHKFWNKLAPSFLEISQGCDTTTQYTFDKKHGMTVGESCDVTAADADTIYVRYSSRASYDGINAARGVDPASNCTNPDERPMCNAADNCTTLACTEVNLGASDVAGTSFTQSTAGWEDGYLNSMTDPYTANETTLFFPNDPADLVGLGTFQPIVVPFAFFVNSAATEYRCTAPGATIGEDYVNSGTSCVPQDLQSHCEDGLGNIIYSYTEQTDTTTPRPVVRAIKTADRCATEGGTWVTASATVSGADDPSWDCVNYFQCNAATGTCSGGIYAGQECDTTADCPTSLPENTMCTEGPIRNITQSMARQIFSGQALNWSAFGPEYVPCQIVKCMRHAGSGTHATFDLAVMDGKQPASTSIPGGPATTWHFTSSSDLMTCVDNYDCSIGYMDADKLLGSDIDALPGLNMVSYNGAKASRRNIIWGIYEFWAAQWVYYDTAKFTSGSDEETLLNDLIAFSSDPANLTADTLGNAADFWAAQGEMQVTRAVDGGIINR